MTNPYAPPQSTVQDIADPKTGVTLASRGTRLAAAVLDGIIVMAMSYVPALVFMALFGGFELTEDGEIANAAAFIAALAAGGVGFAAWAAITIRFVLQNSQSIAKRLLSIKVVRSDGSPVSFMRLLLLRNVVNALLGIIPLYSLVDVLFIFGETQQCLHDKIADTIVVTA